MLPYFEAHNQTITEQDRHARVLRRGLAIGVALALSLVGFCVSRVAF